MSRDKDPQQRLWLSLGYGGKAAAKSTWRYWKLVNASQSWIIAAPNDLAIFEQKGCQVMFDGKTIITANSQWAATWRTLAYFYENVIPNLTPPPLSDSGK